MIRNAQLPENIDQLLHQAKDYLAAHRAVVFAYLFGSLAEGKQKPLSDVDIALYLKKTENPSALKMEILGKLNDILKTDEIDLVILNTAPLMLRGRVLRNKKLLVDKKPRQRHLYESLTLRQSMDFAVFEAALLNRRFFNGRQTSPS